MQNFHSLELLFLDKLDGLVFLFDFDFRYLGVLPGDGVRLNDLHLLTLLLSDGVLGVELLLRSSGVVSRAERTE